MKKDSLEQLAGFPRGRVVKAMDFESEGVCVHVRFPARTIFFIFIFYNDDGGETRYGAGERERRHIGMSAANVGASF